jgi:hypothetical protein
VQFGPAINLNLRRYYNVSERKPWGPPLNFYSGNISYDEGVLKHVIFMQVFVKQRHYYSVKDKPVFKLCVKNIQYTTTLAVPCPLDKCGVFL